MTTRASASLSQKNRNYIATAMRGNDLKFIRVLAAVGFVALLFSMLSLSIFVKDKNKDKNHILFEGDSIYNHITIRQRGDERCMLFGRYRDRRETCIQLSEPDVSVFEYTGMMFVSLLFNPDPERVALLGLGGGYIPLVFRMHLPEIKLDVAEVDPMVEELAVEYFDFVTSQNISLTICDGRRFLKQESTLYDQIWVDTFNSDYIPAHMTTMEFLVLAKSRLTDNGIVVQNVHSKNQLYDAHINTFREVFKNVFVFRGNRSNNAILIGADNPRIPPSELSQQLSRFNGKIGKIDLREQLKKFEPNPKVRETRILTDDYAPANLLIHRK